MRIAEPDPRQRPGRLGEEAAARALAGSGLRRVASRYRNRYGEIDLVAEDGEVVVFVEVKTRAGTGFGAAESVSPKKRKRMARVALSFLRERDWDERPCRFDVLRVVEQHEGLQRC